MEQLYRISGFPSEREVTHTLHYKNDSCIWRQYNSCRSWLEWV